MGKFKRIPKFKNLAEEAPLAVKDRRAFGRGRQPLDKQVYLKLTEWFREHQTDDESLINYTAASSYAGCAPNTARRAYLKGWISRNPPMHPIKEVLQSETERGRVIRKRTMDAIVASQTAEDADRHEDAAVTRAQEGLLVRAAYSAAGRTMVQVNKLLAASEVITVQMIEQLKDSVKLDSFNMPKRTLEENMAVLTELNKFAKRSTEIATVVMELERKRLGRPEKHIQTSVVDVNDAIDKLVRSADDIRRVREGVDPTRTLLLAAAESLDIEAELELAGMPIEH